MIRGLIELNEFSHEEISREVRGPCRLLHVVRHNDESAGVLQL